MLSMSSPAPLDVTDWNALTYAITPQRPLTLDLRVPRSPAPPPLIVYIPMAGFRQCLMKKTPWWLVDHGFAVASIDCRGSGEAIAPAAVHDCKAAVRWLRSKAGEFGYRANAIGAFPHPGDFFHQVFLYHMALNGIQVVRALT